MIVEKFSFKIPRIAQKVERFYKNIVEESLFGKDPDVAEDLSDPKTSTEIISRRRQRNEICVSLKRSKIITKVYVGKNILEIVLVLFFIGINVTYAVYANDIDSSPCTVSIAEFPAISLQAGQVYFQCRGKKMSFFILMLGCHSIMLSLHGLCSVGAIVWCLCFRSVSQLLKKISNASDDVDYSYLTPSDGDSDFLFLFDLLSHSCGLESTLRVLTHSDFTFYEICKPDIDTNSDLLLEEDKLKIVWRPAKIERWLRSGFSHRAITIDSYEVTIFPAETVQNTSTKPANLDLKGTTNTRFRFYY